jgi:hypothetical protein
MPDVFFLWILPVIIVALVVAALFTRDAGEPCATGSMTAQGFADAAAAARCRLDGNPLRSSAWQAQHDRGPFGDLEAALSASYAAQFEQAIRTIQVGPPVEWRPTDQAPGEPEFKAAAGAPPHPHVL